MSPVTILPFKNSTASIISSEFPTARPKGSSIEVITAVIDLFKCLPILTIILESSTASSGVFINAPEPYFTSKMIFPAPAAIFFETTEEAIRGFESIVAVTSRSA